MKTLLLLCLVLGERVDTVLICLRAFWLLKEVRTLTGTEIHSMTREQKKLMGMLRKAGLA